MDAPLFKLQMRRDEVRRLARENLGARSNRALAEKAGLDIKTLSRAMNGRGQPSGVFVATVLHVLDADFDEVFAIIPLDAPQQLAA